MKAKALVVYFPLIFSIVSLAQKSPVKFGDVQLKDLKMSIYENDSSASAVILSDYGETYFSFTATQENLVIERHVRVKILRKEGLKWADISIPLYYNSSGEESVRNLKATSYNLEDGKVVDTKLGSDDIFKEKFSRNYKIQKFTIPNVKEGSVIEYSYRIFSDFVFNFPEWKFQYSIPVKHSEYWAVLPDFLVVEKNMQGYLQVTNYETKNKPAQDYQSIAHHYTMENVPAFIEEPFITCEGDYVSKIKFALSHINVPGKPVREIMGSWKKLNNNLLESDNFGKAITGNDWLRKKTEEITATATSPLEKMNIIFNYVRANLTWDGSNDYTADPLKKVFEARKGTTGDINIALASMLEKAEVPVEMILISTRDHGMVRVSSPMADQFNYVVCQATIDGKKYMLDATDRLLPAGVLPERCLNGQGLIISATNHGWISLATKIKARTAVAAELQLDGAGDLKGKINFSREGYDAHKMRKAFSSKGESNYVKDALNGHAWEVEKTEFQDVEEITKPAKEIHNLIIREHITKAGDIMYINPFVTGQVESNPFKLEERVYPVDYPSPLEKIYTCKLVVPEDYAVDELPKSKLFMLPENAAKYMFNVSQAGNTIFISSNLQINKNIFLPTEYPALREFYNQVVAKQSEQIVLKKK
jgi:hypothetical protein